MKQIFTTFLLWLLSKKEMHGYEIIKTLKQEKGMREVLTPAFIYPFLNSMLEAGLINQRTVKDGRRVKKLYKTSTKGMKTLKQIKEKFFKVGLRRQFLEEMLK
jgi:DNA-binding PadR family transcriptional regulator